MNYLDILPLIPAEEDIAAAVNNDFTDSISTLSTSSS